MKYLDFKNTIKEFPVFKTSDLWPLSDNKQAFKNQISVWKKKNLIIALKKGLYVLNENDRKTTPSREFIANQLIFPSYVSLEYALSFYGIIPEKAYQLTSITTKKTVTLGNAFGVFVFRSIKTSCFFGYVSIEDENRLPFFIAEKEKALLDFLYLNLDRIPPERARFLEESYRMQNLDELDKAKLHDYSTRFGSQKLIRIVARVF